MSELKEMIAELESYIPYQEKTNSAISKASVGWQIEHILLTINKITYAIKKSDPEHYKWQFKLPRIIVFTLKKIPRGRAKAPSIVLPEIFDEKTLTAHLITTKSTIIELEQLDPKKYFLHPYFGNIRLKQTIKFLEIHTNHHLSIIRDIIK
jgi:hypothetical protein